MPAARVKDKDRKSSTFTMAIAPKDRRLITQAARILELPPSIWARAQLLKEAAKVIGEAKAAK